MSAHHHDHTGMNHIIMTTSNNGTSFCKGDMGGGGGMIMYMDGFHFGLAGGQPCLNLFVASWTLDSRTKYVGAILAVFGLAVLVEGSSKLRQVLVKRSRDYVFRQSSHRPYHFSKNTALTLWRLVGVPGIHALQALLGYILMLATMTFAVELLLAVVLGLGVGHAMFFPFDPTAAQPTVTHVTSNPCCQFLEQEARDERQSLLLTTRSEHAHCHDDGAADLQHSSAAPLLQSGDNHHVL